MPACAFTISPSAQKRDTLAVGKRPTLPPHDQLGIVVGNSRRARTRAGSCPIPGTPTSVTSCGSLSARERARARRARRSQLALASDERRAAPSGRRRRRSVSAAPTQARPDRLGLALSPRSERLRHTRSPSRSHDRSCRRRGLRRAGRPPGDVLPCSSRRPQPSPRPAPAGRRAFTSASPVLTPIRTSSSSCGSASFSSAIASWIASAARTARFGVVLMGHRRAEDADDGVADELLDRPAAPLELAAEPVVVRGEDRADVLGVEPLGARRRPDEVGEDHGDDLPLLADERSARPRAASRILRRSGRRRGSRARRKDRRGSCGGGEQRLALAGRSGSRRPSGRRRGRAGAARPPRLDGRRRRGSRQRGAARAPRPAGTRSRRACRPRAPARPRPKASLPRASASTSRASARARETRVRDRARPSRRRGRAPRSRRAAALLRCRRPRSMHLPEQTRRPRDPPRERLERRLNAPRTGPAGL